MADHPANVRQANIQPHSDPVPPVPPSPVPHPLQSHSSTCRPVDPSSAAPKPTDHPHQNPPQVPIPTFMPPPPPPPPNNCPLSPGTSGKHPVFRGIRCRAGKWVSEIREPRKTTRIWLGTYPSPEMAASAYDVAALALKGSDAVLNFPDSVHSYPIPGSASPADIRAAASAAAALRRPDNSSNAGTSITTSVDVVVIGDDERKTREPHQQESETTTTTAAATREEFIDEEALFDMPKLLVNMAEGMLVSPPRITSAGSDDEDGTSPACLGAQDLWNY
ncbi:hypothetical protein Scep_006468 [Stephania cephalantha]|uniref:AP2/ERF domain-containing protein n=1 Tax=Stephania cephalantha TaxID=152367 RepID=A0AAP0K824_9MAGN